jgi:hypothetical protein
MEKHPGSRIDKIPVKGVVGLIFVIGFLIVLLVAVPATRWFLLISLPAGVLVGVIMYIWRSRGG